MPVCRSAPRKRPPQSDAAAAAATSRSCIPIRCAPTARSIAVRSVTAPTSTSARTSIRRSGSTVVIIGALISAVFYWFGRDLIAYGILAGAALVDLVVYGRLKDLTVCYRCHSEFRGAYERRAPAFDLHTADVLEMEYERRIGGGTVSGNRNR